MDNAQRDRIIQETHDAVILIKQSCATHDRQIVTLFEGYNRTQQNSVMIKVIAGVGGFISTALSGILIFFATRK